MFGDWNGNGRTDDAFDDFMDYKVASDLMRDNHGGGGGGSGCCGCALYLFLLPAGIIALVVYLVNHIA